MGEAPIPEIVDRRAVLGENLDLAVVLPEREGLALDEADRHAIRKQLLDGRVLDQRVRQQALARGADVEEGQRGVVLDAERDQHLVVGERHLALGLHRHHPEAERVRGGSGTIAEFVLHESANGRPGSMPNSAVAA